MQYFSPSAHTRILDVGASENEYRTAANILEKTYPHLNNITVLGVDKYSDFYKRYPNVKVISYDGRKFPFKDKEFDIVWSNAVVEHAGDTEAQILFLKEISRVGKSAFITTPNRFFPIEPHTRTLFLHYLPKNIFYSILRQVKKGWATGSYMNLLGIKDLKKLLNSAGIDNYKIVKNSIFGIAIDFMVIF